MKKAVAISLLIAVAAMMNVSAFADVDLSGMSFDELVALKDQINLAIWNSEEWQEVEVPQGVWEVGADIPEGKWTIKAMLNANTYVRVGNEVKNGGTDVSSKTSKLITDEGYSYFDASSDVTSWTIELKVGDYVQIDYGSAVFMPFSGKPSLGFKK